MEGLKISVLFCEGNLLVTNFSIHAESISVALYSGFGGNGSQRKEKILIQISHMQATPDGSG